MRNLTAFLPWHWVSWRYRSLEHWNMLLNRNYKMWPLFKHNFWWFSHTQGFAVVYIFWSNHKVICHQMSQWTWIWQRPSRCVVVKCIWTIPSKTQLTVNVVIEYIHIFLKFHHGYMFRPFTRATSGQYKTLLIEKCTQWDPNVSMDIGLSC
jgi:hypothetical protein